MLYFLVFLVGALAGFGICAILATGSRYDDCADCELHLMQTYIRKQEDQ